MKGRDEHKYQSHVKMCEKLKNKNRFYIGFYNNLFNSKEYLTAKNYTAIVMRFMDYLYLNNIIKDKDDFCNGFTVDNINIYLSSLKGRNGPFSSDSYKATVYTALKRFALYLINSHMLKEDPFVIIDRISIKDSPEIVSMTADELKIIIERISKNSIGTEREQARREQWKERNLAIFSLLIVTGMRVTALVELNIEDISWEEKTITVTDKRRSTHVYELDTETMKTLYKWAEKREELLNGESCSAFFISNRRTRITTKAIRDLVTIYTAGMKKHITPHKFRSTLATLVYEETGDIAAAQEALVHKNISTTKRYTAKKKVKAETANFMSGLLH